MKDAPTVRKPQVAYYSDAAVVRLTGPITGDAVLEVVDEVELLIGYFRYPMIDLHLDSLGGEADALRVMLSRMRAWQKCHGVSIGTLALGTAASAAAILLSLGQHGRRRAYESTTLVYHSARLLSHEGTFWTDATLRGLACHVQRVDQEMVHALAQLAFARSAGNGLLIRLPERLGEETEKCIRTPAELADLYTDLFRTDLVLSAQEAIGLHLIDSIETGGVR